MGKLTATLDSKGRIVIPESLRMSMHLEPGDTLFLNASDDETRFEAAKAINPFDLLARQALDDYRNGMTLSIEDAWKLADTDDE